MPPLDDAMLTKLMQTYGAPMSAENANAARQFFASNPDVAERRAMGMRGSGIDDNSDVFQPSFNKMVDKADGISTTQLPPLQQAESQALKANTPQRAPAPKQFNQPPSPIMQNPNQVNAPIDSSIGKPGGGSDLMPFLMSILGLRAAPNVARPDGLSTGNHYADAQGRSSPLEAEFAGRMPRRASPRAIGNDGGLIEGANPSQPRIGNQPKITSGAPDGNYSSIGKDMETVQNRNSTMRGARDRAVQGEVDDENRLIQEQMKKRKAQMDTQELTNAARRAVGRK